jgi:hypothetical protein
MIDFVMPIWVIQLLQQVGPFAIILLVLFWYVPKNAIATFIDAQQHQAVAMAGIKDALQTMVDREGRLDDKLDVTILNQRLMIGQLEKMEERTEAMHATNSAKIEKVEEKLEELILSGRKAPQPGDPPANT